MHQLSQRQKSRIIVRQIFSGKNSMFSIAAVLLLLFFALKFRFLVTFLVIAIVSGIINYLLHVTDVHVHLGHVSFLSVIFSYTLGFKYGILMIIIAHVLPEILAGHMDAEMVITGTMYSIVSFIASVMTNAAIIPLGLFLTVLQVISTITLGKMFGTPINELITEDGVEFVMNIVYYISLSNILISIIQ